ncbi:MAG: 4-hydroxy-3-methylbut-2-enyl diphosphate reductase [Thermosulfidibacteraceae bacterium]|jgi:4-hydroxy-3-methylbut-2-enyl diphosphate reductase
MAGNKKVPRIIVATKAGFCFGVRRAVRLVIDGIERNKKMCTLGSLIHNPQVVRNLAERGVLIVDSVDDVPDGYTVVIRSHGVTFEELSKIKERNLDYIDATCPFVKRAQDIVYKLRKKNYGILIVGDREHPEVKALLSYAGENGTVYPDLPENVEKVGVVVQTTQTLENFKRVVEDLKEKLGSISELRIFNTICKSTEERQREVIELSRISDVVIVVGGKNSANTRRLFDIAKSMGVDAYHIETDEDIDFSWFSDKEVIAVTAGASTPDWLIGVVVDRIKSMTGGIIDGRV